MRKIAIVTGTRADWGLLSPIAKALKVHGDCQVEILATNMHLISRYGDTMSEIEADGFSDIHRVLMPDTTDTAVGTVNAMAVCMSAMAKAFEKITPDVLVILGDRFEMLATATAAMMIRIPIIHIAGGEISEGAIDDSIRHAITKMSSLHLTATEENRQRVISMGEHPDRVINTGAIGVYNILHEDLLPKHELEESISLSLDDKTLLVTYHPATLDDANPSETCGNLMTALDNFPESHVIITYPNNDSRGKIIIDMIENYGSRWPGRVRVVPSLGKKRYLSALKYVGAVVGNSSSGIVEVPSMHIPTVDIGMRQQGRLHGDSVIHSSDKVEDITSAIRFALSDEGKRRAKESHNPYSKENTLELMVNAIVNTPLEMLKTKTFYDR